MPSESVKYGTFDLPVVAPEPHFGGSSAYNAGFGGEKLTIGLHTNDVPVQTSSGAASFFDCTVGTGGDYATVLDAYTAGKRNVLLISNVTETASSYSMAGISVTGSKLGIPDTTYSYEFSGNIGLWTWSAYPTSPGSQIQGIFLENVNATASAIGTIKNCVFNGQFSGNAYKSTINPHSFSYIYSVSAFGCVITCEVTGSFNLYACYITNAGSLSGSPMGRVTNSQIAGASSVCYFDACDFINTATFGSGNSFSSCYFGRFSTFTIPTGSYFSACKFGATITLGNAVSGTTILGSKFSTFSSSYSNGSGNVFSSNVGGAMNVSGSGCSICNNVLTSITNSGFLTNSVVVGNRTSSGITITGTGNVVANNI